MQREMIHFLQQFLGMLNISVPKAVIRQLLDSPVGYTVRGVSDTLDALGVHNEVYHLPKEYLNQLTPPFLVSFPHHVQQFHVVTYMDKDIVRLLGEKDISQRYFLKQWDGVALVAEKTEQTRNYRFVWLRDASDWIRRHHLLLLPLLLTLFSILSAPLTVERTLHQLMLLAGLYVSVILLYREYRDTSLLQKYCHVGKFVNCKEVELSGGGRLFGFLRLCDASFLYFTCLLFDTILDIQGYWHLSLVLSGIGCLFTLYSVVYQLAVVRKVCLFCMSVNVVVWLDAMLLFMRPHHFQWSEVLPFVLSALLSYASLYSLRNILKAGKEKERLRSKLSHIYRKDLFDFLLTQEPAIEDFPDFYSECSGNKNTGNTVSIVVHPQCKLCNHAKKQVPLLNQIAKVKLLSLDCPQVALFCLQHGISQTPTIMVNGHFLPALYSIDDLIYLL